MKFRIILNVEDVDEDDEATMKKGTVLLCVKASTHIAPRFLMFTQGRWAGCIYI